MSLIIGSPYKGREWHIYEADGDDRSLCGRATNVHGQTSFDIEKVTCIKCKRAWEILSRNVVPREDDIKAALDTIVKKKRPTSKNGKKKPVRSSSSVRSTKPSGKRLAAGSKQKGKKGKAGTHTK